MSKSVKRLYETFKPDHYDLELILDKSNLRFEGKVKIQGRKSGRPSKRITFHQKDLQITHAAIQLHDKIGSKDISVDRIVTQKSYDEVRLHTKELLRAGSYTITLSFKGHITKNMVGIYPSRFNHEGREQIIIGTQFESHHAREAFPCIDEPEAKASFTLTLTTGKSDIVLSNMEPTQNTTKDNLQTVTFDTTPKMSTYLLAFISGPLHSVESKTKDGVLVRSWSSIARPKKELEYSVKEAVDILNFYAEYFDTPYPLTKCDQVALPDFDAGAMENWGLITYREIALLVDPDNRSVANEQYVSLVVAHELAHQWFGNLVTMKWWDDLWLNESFASLMEHISLNKLHPDWQQWEIFTASDVLAATNRDIYKDVQSVGVTVTDPDLIETLFDPGIVYAKGARLLKMLREYIGEEAFVEGLKKYFKEYAYKNTSREDLWVALTESSGKSISELMTPWLTQSGMPLLHVTQNEQNVSISQERYVLDSKSDTQIWPVPLLASPPLNKSLITTKQEDYAAKSTEYIVVNENASGHYFTHYTEGKHRQYLAIQFKNQKLPTETRMNLLNDAIMLARSGESSLTEALELALESSREPRDSVWTLVSRAIGYAQTLTEGDSSSEDNIKEIKRNLSDYWYKRLGWDNTNSDDANTRQLRHTAIAYKIAGEDQSAINEALKRFSDSSSIEAIDAELRSSILSATVKHGDGSQIDALLNAYSSSGPDTQLDITAGLTSTKDPKTAQTIIRKALGANGFVRDQDVMRWIAYFLRNKYSREVMWQFINNEWNWLESTLGASKSFDYLPTYTASAMNTKAWEKRYHDLFKPLQDNKVLSRNITVGFSDIRARILWRERDEQKIKNFFKSQVKKK